MVTARKREENLQTVPIAVSAFTAETIEKLGISSIDDVAKLDASVIFDQGFSKQDTRIVIRGLAPTQGRQNVAVLEDGIDVSSQALQTNGGSLLINPRLFDLERIEVVKGPQNALYGRSAFAGAVNYISRKPGETFEGRVGTEIGSQGELQFKGSLSGPLIGDTLLGSITAATWENDGFYRNTVTGNEVGGEEGYGMTGTLVWKPRDGLSITGRITYSDDEYEVDPYVTIVPNTLQAIPPSAIAGDVIGETLLTIPAVAGTLPNGDSFSGATMAPNPRTGAEYSGTDRDVLRSTLTVAYDMGPVTITSLTHWADADSSQWQDVSREGDYATQFYAGENAFYDETRLFSQELRLQSNNEGPVNWVVGGLYWDESTDFTDSSINCIQVPFGASPGVACGAELAKYDVTLDRYPDPWTRDTEHWSAYALVDWAVRDTVKLVGEVRYTSEDLEVVGPDRAGAPGPLDDRARAFDIRPGSPFTPGLGPIGFPNVLEPAYGTTTAKQDDNFISPKVTMQWSPLAGQMYYLSWAKATKPAGIAVVANLSGFNPDNSYYEPEEMQVWELGAKTAWLDGRLILNGALFYQDYSDKQLSSQVPAGATLATQAVNAGAAEVYGLELEATLQATDYLTVRGSYTYLDTEYTEFLTLDSGAGNIAAAGNCTVVSPVAGRVTCQIDLSGNELEYAPRNAFIGNLAYQRPLRGDTDWFVEADLTYQDERFQRFLNTVTLDSYTTADFRVGISNDQWEVTAYVKNAFDDDTIKTAVNSTWNAGLTTVPNPPSPFAQTLVLPGDIQAILPDQRQFGLRVSYRFGTL